MTSQYNQRMSLAVPEALIHQANQLALVAGEFELDVLTFGAANYEDESGNRYAVCSAAIKPIVLGLLGVNLSDLELPSHAADADAVLAQQALDKLVFFDVDVRANPEHIFIALDNEPLSVFEALGLTLVVEDEDEFV